eukprot:2336330-Amphidinium_carterae.1
MGVQSPPAGWPWSLDRNQRRPTVHLKCVRKYQDRTRAFVWLVDFCRSSLFGTSWGSVPTGATLLESRVSKSAQSKAQGEGMRVVTASSEDLNKRFRVWVCPFRIWSCSPPMLKA